MSVANFDISWVAQSVKNERPASLLYPLSSSTNVAAPNDYDDSMDSCQLDLPFPVQDYGVHVIKCLVCGTPVSVAATAEDTASKSVEIYCRRGKDEPFAENRDQI